MIEIRTQQQLRPAQNLKFCCICGEPLNNDQDRQHVPPKAIFSKADRSSPLILPSHPKCNSAQSPFDEVIGQLLALVYGKYPAAKDVKLEAEFFPVAGGDFTWGVKNLPLESIIFRWIRCFHAALYHEFLPDRGGRVYAPFPAGEQIDGRVVYENIYLSRLKLTYLFKQQMKAGLTDSVTCYNEKCQYRCTWLKSDDGRPFCLFALRLYNWEELGDIHNHPPMGCVGMYLAEIPAIASRGTRLEIPASNFVPLDPFAP
jgi:hypothetical protein